MTSFNKKIKKSPAIDINKTLKNFHFFEIYLLNQLLQKLILQ